MISSGKEESYCFVDCSLYNIQYNATKTVKHIINLIIEGLVIAIKKSKKPAMASK